jgi:hypothetical protein
MIQQLIKWSRTFSAFDVILATGFTSRGPRSVAGAVNVGFVVDKATTDHFLLIFRLFPVILSFLQSYISIHLSAGGQVTEPSKSAASYEVSSQRDSISLLGAGLQFLHIFMVMPVEAKDEANQN